MLAGDLRERHSCAAILYYLFPIYIQSCSSNLPALKFALRMPLLTRSTIKLRSSSLIAATMTIMARPSGPVVSMFSRKTDECDVQVVEFIQNFEKVLYRPRHPVE